MRTFVKKAGRIDTAIKYNYPQLVSDFATWIHNYTKYGCEEDIISLYVRIPSGISGMCTDIILFNKYQKRIDIDIKDSNIDMLLKSKKQCELLYKVTCKCSNCSEL